MTNRTGHAGLDLEGVWVPIVTPFSGDGSVDEQSLRRLAERLLADGVAGLVALGTTGEPATMDSEERRRVVRVCAAACANAGGAMIVGAGTNSTAGTTSEIEFLTSGCDVAAALVVEPYYTRPSQEAVVEHFGIVADQSPVPLVIYNIPYRTGRGLDAPSLAAAGAHPNIAGLKQAVGALDPDTLALLARADPGFEVLAGDDAFIAPTVLMGGTGAIAAAAHVCTPLFVEMVAAARAGRLTRTVELSHALLPVVTAGFAEPSPAVWKGALAYEQQIGSGSVRRPLTAASPGSVERLIEAAHAAELRAERM